MSLRKVVPAVLLVVVLMLGILHVYLRRPFRVCLGGDESRDRTETRVAVDVKEPQNQTASRSAAEFCKVPDELHLEAPDGLTYQQPGIVQGRTDVVTVTPWLAPLVWERTFNPLLLDGIYRQRNISVAVTVFAVGRYTRFLKDFLETAEQHFFVGFHVHVYVFTDRPDDVPRVKMAADRQVTVVPIPGSNRWQQISASRMQRIQTLIEEQLLHNADYVFCLDVDSRFQGRWGAESLGGLVAAVHPGYYRGKRGGFPYERRPASRAFVAPGDGDFYYGGAVFGGALQEVHRLARTCRENLEADAAAGVEAAWQEESHLNRYLWTHKPTKVLSPEYLWQDFKPRNLEIHIVRFSGVIKNYQEIRPN
ncbi:globoside alpha-1,3-N-acetylgalactosaminyltransferase 1-like [Cololabis saira]|uniref:globoside alpha-1,3-N-acetylgalactosaminyltransferase 1-like n=1 Tax=Cololabis saira TaxID=129043 RepID=UPI002AD41D35|nr:globoside alpha-1,3-N-acetylgalactosaminyltransferase 1-like [Cololabis saira]